MDTTPTQTVAPATPLTGKKLLIVEDDSLLHNLLANKLSLLRAQGVQVFPTYDAAQAQKIVEEQKPDLILLDLMLPGMTGFEFLESMHAKNPASAQIPVIIFSNLNQETDHERAAALGVKKFMVKADSSLEEIMDTIRIALSTPASS